jgi:hypothetical protein
VKISGKKILFGPTIATDFVRFDVFTEVTMKNAVLWDVMPCGLRTDVSEEPRALLASYD